MQGQDVVPMAQGEGLSSDIEDALHEFHSFSPPCQIPEPEVPSIPLNIVYEDVTQGKSLKKPHQAQLAVRRSTHWIHHQKQRVHWHEHVLPKLI